MADRSRILPWLLVGGIVSFALVFFFQYKDPMILVFALISVGMMLLGMRIRKFALWGQVRVRCRKCGMLNLEDARYCGQCREPM